MEVYINTIQRCVGNFRFYLIDLTLMAELAPEIGNDSFGHHFSSLTWKWKYCTVFTLLVTLI